MNIRTVFQIGQSYTPEELTSSLSHAFTNSGIVQTRYISEKRSKEIFRLLFNAKRNSKKGVYTILSENPKQLVIKSQMTPIDSKSDARLKKAQVSEMSAIMELLGIS